MNKLIIATAVLLLGFCGQTMAQGADAFETQNKVYKAALKNFDLQVAANALYNMLALKPERTDLNDSLALVYFAGERYAQAYVIGEEIVKQNPKRKDMLELVAVSKQNLGMVKESLSDYEKLYDMEKSIFYLYQMATLQYELKRFGECVASLDQIIANADATKQKVNIRTQGGTQEVIMKAAAYNVRGICAIEMNQKDAARENFTKAIEADPNFALAKANLESLDKPQQGAATGPAKTSPATSNTRPQSAPQKTAPK